MFAKPSLWPCHLQTFGFGLFLQTSCAGPEWHQLSEDSSQLPCDVQVDLQLSSQELFSGFWCEDGRTQAKEE